MIITMSLVAGMFLSAPALSLDIHILGESGSKTTAVYSQEQPVFVPAVEGAALSVIQPSGISPIRYAEIHANPDGILEATSGLAPGLELSERWRRITPALWERIVTVRASSDTRYYLDLAWKAAVEGTFHTFERQEDTPARYSLGFAGPGFNDDSLQTFPMVGIRSDDSFFGIIGDTSGKWENRSWLDIHPESRLLSIKNGDGSPKRVAMIPHNLDATTIYRAQVDGWQHIEAGETQSFTTWIYASQVQNHYDIQLSAHLALGNAKGFNSGALEAILRNTSYLLLRRNLFRTESDHIFVSGVGYGWKQWVSDGFWMSRGLDDPLYDADANTAVFYDRVSYEDNAQYYLIWSYLVKRAGGTPDARTVSRAYHFMRKHEVDGLFIPPRLTPDKKNMKTYHDQLEYEDDDAPSSNQGFHCGALMAAKELGFPVEDADIERAIAGYARMFNEEGGYFATSLLQQDRVGQDALYGAVLTYAVFGRKTLPDDLVKRHLETTMKIQSPYGMRVISKPNGELLDGHSGVYVFGGSWFLNDACNYLCGLIHGMDPTWVNDQLLWRLEKELAWMPAFHESISTVTGKPHGHHLYSWNSGFWWLHKETLGHLGKLSEDTLQERLDARLGVTKQDGYLRLVPAESNLQRSK